MILLEYPKCSTCRKAIQWLKAEQLVFEDRDIKEAHPDKDELTSWIKISGLPAKKFFNTSGQRYKELGLKDRLKTMTEEEQIELLSTDGMLVKRPLLVTDSRVLVGFKEEEWRQALKERV